MGIVIIRQDGKINQWKAALKAAAPDIEVYSYFEEHPKDQIEMALVWKHPTGSLAAYPNLKYIASSGAGVDFIFEDETVPKSLPITRVVDTMLASDMAEYVLAVVFAYLKQLNTYKIDQMNANWNPRPYHRIADFRVGIMGMGALGTVLANDMAKYGFKVHGWANSKKNNTQIDTFCGQNDLDAFLAITDILVCLLPLTENTAGILNRGLFEKLPKGAHIINAARGGHLVDADLLQMIDNGHLSGASLDVFHQEPLPADHPFWAHEKINITPHYASVSDTASVVPQIIENYRRMQAGLPLLHFVSPEKGY